MTLTSYQGDVRDADLVAKIFETHTISAVIHFAAKKAVGESCKDPRLYYEENIA
jgi:UDP-glucose 4-epimerase